MYDCLVFQEGVFIEEGIFVEKIILQASAVSRDTEDWFFFCMSHFMVEMFAGLKMFRGVARV